MRDTEADTCRKYVLPKLYAAGWTDDQICEQRFFTDGRIVPAGKRHFRKPGRKADYLLRYRPDFPIAVVEAKGYFKNPGDGLQQALEYADILGLKFAFSINGRGIIEHDLLTGRESDRFDFPTPEDLWSRLRGEYGLKTEADADDFLTPFNRDYFDLILVDECHRGSARDESNWRQILDYFEPATQIGMTATPLRRENRDTYLYFGNPVYTYTLARGVEDGFLAPFRVHRVVPDIDATGWRPEAGQRDRFGRLIPDAVYGPNDFERLVSILPRTETVAHHLTEYLKKTDRFAKTIVFCVDQEHAEAMRMALNNANPDLARQYPNYVARVVSDEGDIGRKHLDDFVDPEKRTPVIVTTSQLLTTGVDVPTCRNIVLFKPVGSMVEFKQIIGRGTRLAPDYDKLWFTILDYAGATRLFADPDFDGQPDRLTAEEIDANGDPVRPLVEPDAVAEPAEAGEATGGDPSDLTDDGEPAPRKYYVVEGVKVAICASLCNYVTCYVTFMNVLA